MTVSVTPPSRPFDFFFPCSSAARNNRIPFEQKLWVQEAKKWQTAVRKRPGYIEVIGRFGNQKEVYWVPPGTKFLTIKAKFAYDHRDKFTRPRMSPSALTLYWDGVKLPDEGTVKEYELEDGDVIDIYYDRSKIDLSG